MKGNDVAGTQRKRVVDPARKADPARKKSAALAALPREAAAKAVAPATHQAGLGANLPDTDLQRWVQAALNLALGTRLPLDGRMTPMVREALRRFQRQEGLQTHGAADEKTLQVLELRVGAQRPRGAGHEEVRSLLILPNRALWMPKPNAGKGGSRGQGPGAGGQAATEASETADAAATVEGGAKVGGKRKEAAQAQRAAEGGGPVVEDDIVDATLARTLPGPRGDAVSPTEAFGQRESWRAVWALVLSGQFLQRATEASGRSDLSATRKELELWFEGLVLRTGADAPAWLRTARADARMDSAGAASLIRQAWWVEHVGAAEGL